MVERPAPTRGLIDTSVVIDLELLLDPASLPEQVAVSALTMAELAAGPHAARDRAERARRQDRLQRAEAAFSIHARGLADIRKASNLTQQQMAQLLGTDQGTISKIERRDDLLLSTLRQYLAATGAVHPKIVIEKDGVEITLELDAFRT